MKSEDGSVELISVPNDNSCRRFVDPKRLELGLMACGFVRDSEHRKEFTIEGKNIYREGQLVAYLEENPEPIRSH